MGLRDLAKKVLGRSPPPAATHTSPPPAVTRPAAPVAPKPAAAPAKPSAAAPAEEEDKPWYLQGQEDLDGWDETNPGEEPGKKNLRD